MQGVRAGAASIGDPEWQWEIVNYWYSHGHGAEWKDSGRMEGAPTLRVRPALGFASLSLFP